VFLHVFSAALNWMIHLAVVITRYPLGPIQIRSMSEGETTEGETSEAAANAVEAGEPDGKGECTHGIGQTGYFKYVLFIVPGCFLLLTVGAVCVLFREDKTWFDTSLKYAVPVVLGLPVFMAVASMMSTDVQLLQCIWMNARGSAHAGATWDSRSLLSATSVVRWALKDFRETWDNFFILHFLCGGVEILTGVLYTWSKIHRLGPSHAQLSVLAPTLLTSSVLLFLQVYKVTEYNELIDQIGSETTDEHVHFLMVTQRHAAISMLGFHWTPRKFWAMLGSTLLTCVPAVWSFVVSEIDRE